MANTALSTIALTTIALTTSGPEASHQPHRYVQVMESLGAEIRLLMPENGRHRSAKELLDGVSGLMLRGGPDVDPELYGQTPDPQAGLEVDRALDDLDLKLLDLALQRDLPVLAICRGMQLLNVALGGSLIQDLPGHRTDPDSGSRDIKSHEIYLSPGSKAAAVIGMAGFFKVNSLHHQGLREAQRSPKLMATAFAVDDGLVEGLESPDHSWVIGLQCHPERQKEVPGVFANLFLAFLERAEAYGSRAPA
jgi:putative glutamine amidotransferase